jgi:hypothetical protein
MYSSVKTTLFIPERVHCVELSFSLTATSKTSVVLGLLNRLQFSSFLDNGDTHLPIENYRYTKGSELDRAIAHKRVQ